jgi:phosphoserine phosphatase RsbX
MGTVKRGMSASDRMAVECGIAAQPLRGEIESGDLHAVIARPDAILIAVVDGLWHGYEAAVAARVAVVTLTAQAHLPLLPLVKCCHEALIKTRGVAMSVALLERGNDTMAWLSIGNVAGIRLRADDRGRVERQHILTVGHRLPPVRAATLRLHRGDLLVFATDGVREGFHSDVNLHAPPQEIADRILAQHGKATDDALVLVERWNGAGTVAAT